jgi:hypothetical protein
MVSSGGDGKQLLAARAAAWRARGKPAERRGGSRRAWRRRVERRWSRREPRAAQHDGLRRRCRGAEEGVQRKKNSRVALGADL